MASIARRWMLASRFTQPRQAASGMITSITNQSRNLNQRRLRCFGSDFGSLGLAADWFDMRGLLLGGRLSDWPCEKSPTIITNANVVCIDGSETVREAQRSQVFAFDRLAIYAIPPAHAPSCQGSRKPGRCSAYSISANLRTSTTSPSLKWVAGAKSSCPGNPLFESASYAASRPSPEGSGHPREGPLVSRSGARRLCPGHPVVSLLFRSRWHLWAAAEPTAAQPQNETSAA